MTSVLPTEIHEITRNTRNSHYVVPVRTDFPLFQLFSNSIHPSDYYDVLEK